MGDHDNTNLHTQFKDDLHIKTQKAKRRDVDIEVVWKCFDSNTCRSRDGTHMRMIDQGEGVVRDGDSCFQGATCCALIIYPKDKGEGLVRARGALQDSSDSVLDRHFE